MRKQITYRSWTTRITSKPWLAGKSWMTRKPRIAGRSWKAGKSWIADKAGSWTTNLPWIARSRLSSGRWQARKFWTMRKPWSRARWLALTGTGVLSAGLMYYFDSERGRRRRSRLGDKAVHAGHVLQSGFGKTGRDIRNRTRGVLAWGGRLFRFRRTEDDVLAARVRAHLGRAVSHPGSIEVSAQQGTVTLSGPVLAREVEQLLRHTHSVHGVREIENRLDVYDEPGSIPGLQGAGTPRSGMHGAFRQPNWPPAVRVIAGAAGSAALIYGAWRRGSLGTASAIAGSLLVARSATNLEFRRLTGIGARRRAIDVHKSIHIDAPVSQVFALWSNFENFPTFMSHVRSVSRLDGGDEQPRWRWSVDGPAGTAVEFDTAVVAYEPDRLLAWRTESSSAIRHAGRVDFVDNPDGSTTAEIHMTYNPIAGALGHAVARFFGADPKRQMDDDLVRMKTYIETGKPPRDAAQPPTTAAPKSGSLH